MSKDKIVLELLSDEVQKILQCFNIVLKAEPDAITASTIITPLAVKISEQYNSQISTNDSPPEVKQKKINKKK